MKYLSCPPLSVCTLLEMNTRFLSTERWQPTRGLFFFFLLMAPF